MKRLYFFFASLVLAAGCANQTADHALPTPPAAAEEPPSDPPGAPPAASSSSDAGVTKPPPATPSCAATFGTAITEAFGRLDGTVRAVVLPGDTRCHSDPHHVIVQIDAGSATYEIYVNVDSTLASDPDVRFATHAGPLVGAAWSAGWHASPGWLGYATTFDVHTGSFTASPEMQLATKIASLVPVGAHVSAYADGFTEGTGAHKVHFNGGGGEDGALVVDADGSPQWLLFAFAEDNF